MRVRFAASLLVGVLSASRVGFAQGEAAAEALFVEGRKLVAEGKVAEGCSKLAASQKLDPAAGTLIHLGDCQEKLGRTASAWASFREAASRATAQGRADWADIAHSRALELETKLSRLAIVAPAGVEVKRGDEVVPAGALGTALPVDPGEHVVSASAPGKIAWRTTVRVAAAAGTTTVTVPPLEDAHPGEIPGARAAPAPMPGAREERSDGSTQRVVGWTLASAGIAGIVVGTIEGLVAISKNNSSKRVCGDDGECADATAREDNADARSAATVSTVAFVAGGLLGAGGLVLLLTAPGAKEPQGAPARVTLGPTGIRIGGTW
jgi:hypothetical protein